MSSVHITLLGKEALPAYYPIAADRPDIVHLLGTNENTEVASRLQKVIRSSGIECHIHIVDAFDISSTIKVCEGINSSCPVQDELTYNVTGGTKLMAIGAFIVAQRHKAKVIYTDSGKNIDLNTFETEPLSCSLDNGTIFTLQGQQVKSKAIYTADKHAIECATAIMDYVVNNSNVHERLIKYYIRNNGKVPALIQTGNTECLTDDHGQHIEIARDYTTILDIMHPNATKLLFEGRWWETLVANEISKWSNGRYKIWCGTKFEPRTASQPNQTRNDKNEIDILFNAGNTFIFVECKSGMVKQDDIYKMKFIRETYGSDKSKSVLVSFCHIQPDIREKAKEAKIDLIACQRDKKALERIPAELDKILKSLKA